MNVLPHEDLTIITKLKPDEAEFALRTKIILYDRVKNTIQYDQGKSYLYIGNVNRRQFSLQCNIHYHKIPLIVPIIKGTIEPYEDGSKISIRITLTYRILVSYFLIVLFEALFICVAIASKEWPSMFLAIITPPLAYFGLKIDLTSNSVSIKSDLRKIFA